MPRQASLNWKNTSGFSGFPKFRQSVMPSGSAPVHATLRAASATVALPPSYGSSATSRLLQSTLTASAKGSPSTRKHAGVAAGAEDGRGLHRGVVLLVHPPLAGDRRRVEQRLERRVHVDAGGAAGPGLPPRRGGRLARLGGVDRAVVHQRLAGNFRHGEPVVPDAEEPVVGHLADLRSPPAPTSGRSPGWRAPAEAPRPPAYYR